jgi:hypothetical protein
MQDNKEEFPSLPEQGKNLAKFTFEVVKSVVSTSNHEVYVSNQVKEERMNTCKTCEYYHYQQNRCRHCGCWLEHKVKFIVSECPLQKWTT